MNFTAKSTDPLLNMSDIPAPELSNIDVDYQGAMPQKGDTVATIHTSFGDISFRFFDEVAPMAVANFKALAEDGRYDGTIFHRITTVATSGLAVVQGGDYTEFNGTGGVSAFGESFGYEVCDYVHNTPGSVAMAHSSLPDSNGSQFYINVSDNNFLDGDYTVFGQVYDGMDVVNAIAVVDTDYSDRPLEDVVISVEIHEYEG